MKPISFFFAIGLLGIMASCSKNEMAYSCNPGIDSWVKGNLQEVRVMTRAAYLELPDAYQRAVFGAFTSEKKMEFWQVKIAEVLALQWSSAEKDHINQLRDLIQQNPQWFSDRRTMTPSQIEAIEDDITLKIYQWKETAREILSWDDKQIYAIVAAPGKMIHTDGTLMLAPVLGQVSDLESSFEYGEGGESGESGEGGELLPWCDCSPKSDWCSDGSGCWGDRCAIPVYETCGTFLLYRCSGTCISVD